MCTKTTHSPESIYPITGLAAQIGSGLQCYENVTNFTFQGRLGRVSSVYNRTAYGTLGVDWNLPNFADLVLRGIDG